MQLSSFKSTSMQLSSFKDLPQIQIKTVSPKLNNLEEPPTEDAEQLPIFIKMVSPKLKDSEEPPVKNTEQLPTPSRMVLPDLLASNTTRTSRWYLRYNWSNSSPAYTGTRPAYIGTSCDDRNVTRASILAHWRMKSSLTVPKLYPSFLFWYSFYILFSFYSFDYTIKSGGVCNRLPDLAYYPVLLVSALSYMSHYLWLTRLLSASPTTFCPIFHVFIPLDFHRFTIKLLGQFHTLQKLTK